MQFTFRFITVFIFSFLFSAHLFAAQNFGGKVNMDTITNVSDILATPENFIDKNVTIKGTIVKVCKMRGCWVELTSDKRFQTFRVKVRDGDMVFPMSAMGKTAYAEGKIKAIPLSLETSKQYLAYQAEEMQEKFDPDSITEAVTLYQLSPQNVMIED